MEELRVKASGLFARIWRDFSCATESASQVASTYYYLLALAQHAERLNNSRDPSPIASSISHALHDNGPTINIEQPMLVKRNVSHVHILHFNSILPHQRPFWYLPQGLWTNHFHLHQTCLQTWTQAGLTRRDGGFMYNHPTVSHTLFAFNQSTSLHDWKR